ncbi:hypothetical protein HPB49_011410 [Dermacentor silvarum]|uniref:Uncharacterized protein n=1 Tax=Dermacentor silvarum TaxID=543639 RepID=A0ACB8CKZ5_DERSI|nr:hypothetical protein HPB49_011410 [Dermacentor silvarum]
MKKHARFTRRRRRKTWSASFRGYFSLKNGVKRGAACIFIAISCAAIAVSALVIYDVIKIAITTKTSTVLRTRPGGRTTAVQNTRRTVRHSRVTRTDSGRKASSGSHERHDVSSTPVGEHHGSNADVKNATKGTYPETRQFSRATESTAAKVTIPKRPELPRQTTSGGDLLETETAVTNGTTDRGATGIGSANGLVERTKKVSHEDVTRLFSKADDQTTSEGHFQEASVDNVTDIQNATGLNREVFVSASSLSYGTSDTNKTFSGETDAGMSRNVSISVSVIDTDASFAPDESAAKTVPREAPTSPNRSVTRNAEGEAFETAPDDSFYGTTVECVRVYEDSLGQQLGVNIAIKCCLHRSHVREGRMGGEVHAANRLLCTAGSRASSEEMLPPDGLCDLMFYTDVVWQDGALRGAQNKESWEAFQAAAQAATRTGHGLRANDFFGSLTTPLGRQKLRELFFKNVVHYGILKAAGTVAQLLEDMHGKLTLLKALKQLQEKFMLEAPTTKPRLDVALGIRFTTYDSPEDSKHHSAAMTALSNHLPITVFIVHTHIADWESGRYPLIGTLWNHGQEVTNAVSAPSLLCSRKTGVSVVSKGLVKLHSLGYNRTYAYDDAETMTAKAVAFFKLYQHVRQGWAVFDTEFEDYDDTCGNGTFSRLKAFKAKLGT